METSIRSQQTVPAGPSRRLTDHLFSGGVWAFGGKVSAAVLFVASNALLARLLTPEDLGTYFLIFSLASAASILAQLGLNQAVVRLAAEFLGTHRPADARAAVRWALVFGMLGSLAVAAILVSGAGPILARSVFHSPAMAKGMGLAALWVIVLSAQSLLAESFRDFHDIRSASLFGGLIAQVLSVLLFVSAWMIYRHLSLHQALVLSVLTGLTSVCVAGILLQRKVRSLKGPVQLNKKEVLTVAWPLLVTGLSLFVLVQADLWILGAFCSPSQVALYGASARLAMLVFLPLVVVNAVIQPLIAQMYAQGRKKELEQILRTTVTFAAIPAALLALTFLFWGGFFLKLLYGSYYQGGTVILVLLSVGQLVNVCAGSCGLTLMMTGHQTTMMRITLFCGFLTIVLSLALVGSYGPVGVAAASCLGLVLQNIAMWWGAKRKTGMWTHLGPTNHFPVTELTGCGS